MGQMTFNFETEDNEPEETQVEEIKVEKKESKINDEKVEVCLLYTSDAADE